MSKDNKVNPGQYTQRGRLTPDDAARELAKQRETASPRKAEGSKFGEPAAAAKPARNKAAVTEKDKAPDDEEDKD
jgi:hypothetical protein